MGDLSPHFNHSEFACKCGCGFDIVSPELISHLEASRIATGLPYRITSGCRCSRRNISEKGSLDSDHLTGEGADIYCPDSSTRYKLLADFLPRFRRIGVGKTFLHVGVNLNNPQEVAWLY